MSEKGNEKVPEEEGEREIVQDGTEKDLVNSVSANGNRWTEEGEATNLDDGVVLYEAELELSALERSPRSPSTTLKMRPFLSRKLKNC